MRLLALALLLVAGSEVSAAELPALAEGSWEYHGRVTATACVGSRCATRRQPVDGSFFVTNDGDSGGPPVIPVCPDVSVPDLTGFATWQPARRGWLRLHLIEREPFVQFLRDCTGYESLRLQGLSARIRVQSGGEGFDLRESLRFSVVVQGQFVQAVGAARLRATRVADGGFVPALRSREGDGRSAPERAIDAIIGDR
ncbi:MAG: hypothetical protein E6J79_15345 [Deltaproteobacteria bacterium]|nr:MAG: hypothetical protein E6J79_15345 [Deltaproteobacteria bacterium]